MSTTDARFSVNLDIYDSHILDVEEIMVVKAAKCAIDDAEGYHANEGTVRVSPSPTTDHTVEEEMENEEDATDE